MRLVDFNNNDGTITNFPAEQLVLFVIDFVLSIILVLSIGILTLFQLYLISSNMTNIESNQNDKVINNIRRGNISADEGQYPYDLGLIENLKVSLGNSCILWGLPFKNAGNGINFSSKSKI